jgi:hypothetical protein
LPRRSSPERAFSAPLGRKGRDHQSTRLAQSRSGVSRAEGARTPGAVSRPSRGWRARRGSGARALSPEAAPLVSAHDATRGAGSDDDPPFG